MIHTVKNKIQLDNLIEYMTKLVKDKKKFSVDLTQGESVTRKMQKYYFGVIIPAVIEWNKECSYFAADKDSTYPVLNDATIDDLLRLEFYSKVSFVNGEQRKTAKRLNFAKGDRIEACNYFDVIINFLRESSDFYIPLPDYDEKWYYERYK